ncbi:NADH:ubiquinone oxidoreductase, 17.2kDa subunit [Metarhizium album ARSEF 1941]|uniref:NADH:ubiquinone oxidoreductase, 17.2kDa subunit n=1 Tax=Metarhizium album (strain ARSEF 1941) TaxID=1081103 RepID=A0A0B2WRZ3_METAS|nr:NADH:ubiquinone oxidoreductase, 17.2kDa subunit [Metarhizium album ARSEF 1941]KHN96242.1 NADH:ubiquinone oxidoreductase, 17.2kDa subunit [Metarhizium album ARSEF 1941]
MWPGLANSNSNSNSDVASVRPPGSLPPNPEFHHVNPAPHTTMSPKHIGPVARTWYRWKALRLPWRKRLFVGYDLQGNTYWEFRLARPSPGAAPSDSRWRRIVHYPRSTHYSQVQVSPLWHQWLRHTRRDPPSLEEQAGDVARQARMRRLAAEADARWEAKPRVMDDVGPAAQAQEQLARPAGRAEESSPAAPGTGAGAGAGAQPEQDGAPQRYPGRKEDPWTKARARGPGESWQPSAWNPAAAVPKKR